MPIDRNLEGQHAIITGGSRGIGAAVATALAARGASITLMARSIGDLREHAATLQELGGPVQVVECDVADEASVDRAFERAESGLGAARILINNAGTAKSAKFAATSRAMWDLMIGVNLTGTYLCTARAMPAMLAAKNGRIVNIASTAGLRGYKTMTAYCAAKHGVIGFTRALALETAKAGVTVNAVCPGYTDTDLTDTAVDNIVNALGKTPEEARAMLVAIIPRGVMTTPGEVAAAVAWLCAPESAAITGVALPVAGGEVT
ncbi:MAG: short-chain dehydrogenase/reductase [Gemmatimonadetes bacterium]|nr:short-chain dehydrogenase/reductase [Gemmatimonadota bacterium]